MEYENEFVFVVLHYITIEDTIKCVNSIEKKCKNVQKKIIIVDNGSNNNSGETLAEKYKANENIHVIINKQNLGFSKGNNIGFKYAKEVYNPKYIILCNNDIVMIQDAICELINKEYNKSNFAVLGPKILIPNNGINGLKLKIPSYQQVRRKLIKAEYDLLSQYVYILKFPRWLYRKIKKKNKQISNNDLTEKYFENIVLHGCFWIFSPEYISLFDGLDDRTFLYHEEELLALRLKRNNLKSIYNPELVVFHNEDSSTNAITKTKRKKAIFVDENQIKSIKILMKEMQKVKE